MKNIYKLKPSKFILDIVLSLIDEIEFIPTLKVREIMFNKDSGRAMGGDMGMPPVFSQA